MSFPLEDHSSNLHLKIRYCISNRIYEECPYYDGFSLRWMPLMPYFHKTNTFHATNINGKEIKYIDLQMSISDIFSKQNSNKFDEAKGVWFDTYSKLLYNLNLEDTNVPFKKINSIVNTMKQFPKNQIDLFKGITLKNVLKATSFGTYVFDAAVKITNNYSEDIIIKVTTLYDFGYDKERTPNFGDFSQSLISDGPPMSKSKLLKKMFEQYNKMACNDERSTCSLFPHHSHSQIKPDYIVYMNEAWQEIITWINLFPESFYGHVNLIDPDTGALYCVLFMKKYHSTFYDLIYTYFNEYASNIPKTLESKDYKTFNDHIPNLIHTLVVQIVYVLIPHFKTYFNYCHNDLKSDNIVYSKTTIEYIYLYLKFGDNKTKLYKIPTYSRKLEFIDGAFSSVTLATNKKNKNDNDRITNVDMNRSNSPLLINNTSYEKTKENVIFCSKNIYENLGQSTMNFFNTFTDVAQLSYSILRALKEWNIYPSKRPLSKKWEECIQLLKDLCALDDRIDNTYEPILKESINLRQRDKLNANTILTSYADKEWSTEMYTVVSECCTYGCPKRQNRMISHLAKYEVKDLNEIKSVLAKYTVSREVDGKIIHKLKTVYPKFVIMRANNLKPPKTYKSDSIELGTRMKNIDEQKELIEGIINKAAKNNKVYTINRQETSNRSFRPLRAGEINAAGLIKNNQLRDKKYHHVQINKDTNNYQSLNYYEPSYAEDSLYDYNIYETIEEDCINNENNWNYYNDHNDQQQYLYRMRI